MTLTVASEKNNLRGIYPEIYIRLLPWHYTFFKMLHLHVHAYIRQTKCHCMCIIITATNVQNIRLWAIKLNGYYYIQYEKKPMCTIFAIHFLAHHIHTHIRYDTWAKYNITTCKFAIKFIYIRARLQYASMNILKSSSYVWCATGCGVVHGF